MDRIEKVARAMCVAGGYAPDEIMPNDGPRWRYYVPGAEDAIAALDATPTETADERQAAIVGGKVYYAVSRDGVRPDHHMFTTREQAVQQATGQLRVGLGGGRRELCIIEVASRKLATVRIDYTAIVEDVGQ